MSKTKIFVHRFSNSNGVGKSAIALYENLRSLNHEAEIYCMQTTPEFQSYSNVHVFPLKLPYSLEVFLLPIWGFFVKKSGYIIHGFEIYVPKTSVYHLHFDFTIAKIKSSKINFRIFARFCARQLSEYGFSRVVKRNILIVTPSNLMSNRLKSNFLDVKLNVETIPNQLNTSDLNLIRRLEENQWRTETAFYEKFALENSNVAILANGDWDYKGLKEIDYLIEKLPVSFRIVLIGGLRQPIFEERHAERIVWFKALDREQLLLVLRSMKGNIIASEFESFSMAALESVAIGVPTLILGQAGICEYYWEYSREVKESKLIFGRDSITEWVTKLDSNKRLQMEFNDYLTSLRQEKVRNIMNALSS